jgi:hypothetical protein
VVYIARPTGMEMVWVVLVDAPINGPFCW